MKSSPSTPQKIPAQSPASWANSRRFYAFHLWLPLLVFAALSAWLMGLHGDLWWADRLYAWEGHRWALKSARITEQLIHRSGRVVSAIAWCTVALAWVVASFRPSLARWRRPLGYLALSTLVATLIISVSKDLTNVDCPWDVLRYGGDRAYLGVWSARPAGMPHAVCFPAGHASGGYCWVALYFFFAVIRPRWRCAGLAGALAVGLLFGFAQQLRGAHFLSHDVWTLMICWLTALLTYLLLFKRAAGTAPVAGTWTQ